MNIDVAYYTAVGGRDKNEDFISLLENNNRFIAIAADGLGGHAAGEIASHLAVNTINSVLIDKEMSISTLEESIDTANRAIISDESSDSMRTTIAVAWVSMDRALFATIGDTRIYHFRNNDIVYQSIDHSVSQMSVMAGEIAPHQIRGHKDRNKLVRVLGNKERVKADIVKAKLEPRDAILICSDGFWENIIENEMCRTLSHSKNSKEWLRQMRQIVDSVTFGSHDNHSAIAFFINR